MEALISSIILSEIAATCVLVKIFEVALPKALLYSFLYTLFCLVFTCISKLPGMAMSRSLDMRKNPEKEEKIRRIMVKYGLWKYAPRDLDIRIIKDDSINACALWKNIIGLNTGLLESMEEAEIAAVIGHELGHLHYRDALYSACAWGLFAPCSHAFAFVTWIIAMTITPIFMLFLGEELSIYLMAVIFGITAMLRRFCTVFIKLRFQWCEHRADLFSASISPELRKGMISFFEKIAADSVEPGLYGRLYGTHPSPRRRVQKIKEVFDREN
ncbi:MAG TPA: M48 family metalloprotease [Bacillota bacterium]|nr:M48 family metalloprotease [Bacillota bacterium]